MQGARTTRRSPLLGYGRARITGGVLIGALIRRTHGRFCLKALQRQMTYPGSVDMQRSAVVFSPHFDDETLGAGGTIILRRRAGAAVHLVFMTDGSKSHAAAMDEADLSAIRRAEALEASEVLGVPKNNVTFLDFPEMRLSQHRVEAVRRVTELLLACDCDDVFVPSTLEPLLWSADHNVTTDVVFQALERTGQRPEVLEYLVWFWYHWPWVPLEWDVDIRGLLSLTWRNRFGLPMWTGLNTAVPIEDALSEKRAALDRYASQMTRLCRDRPWPVLSDIGNGDFLARFFQPNEFFKRYMFREQ